MIGCSGTGEYEVEKEKNHSILTIKKLDYTTDSGYTFIYQYVFPGNQWWSVTKYNYFVTVLKYIFQVSVLYWSSFILSNFYFYFTTFQSIRSYFLLHYIS